MRERKLDKKNERNAEFAKRTDDLYEKIRTQVIDKVTVRRTRNNIKNVPAYKKDLANSAFLSFFLSNLRSRISLS